MKQLIIIGLLWLLCVPKIQSQTTIANGSWTNPFTWNCTCVPLPGASVTIAHQVTLNTDWAYTAGSITINAGGALLDDASGRSMLISGSGAFTLNGGKFDIEYLLVQSTGNFSLLGTDTAHIRVFANFSDFDNTNAVVVTDSFYNDGVMQNLGNGHFVVRTFFNDSTLYNEGAFVEMDSFYNNGTINNEGSIDVTTFYNNKTLYNNSGSTIFNLDSATNAGTLLNADFASIICDSFLNIGTLTNDGYLQLNYIFNSDIFTNNGLIEYWYMTNFDQFTNNDSLMGINSFWNIGDFYNASSGKMYIGGGFLNSDLLGGTAVFENDGQVDVVDSWTNVQTVKGSGNFTVQNLSDNSGSMLEDFDFCDYTPPASAPFIDFNVGTISPTVTFCQPNPLANQTINALQTRVYPNPAKDYIYVEDLSDFSARVVNALGQVVLQTENHDHNYIDIGTLPTGLYHLQLQSGEQTAVFMVQKY